MKTFILALILTWASPVYAGDMVFSSEQDKQVVLQALEQSNIKGSMAAYIAQLIERVKAGKVVKPKGKKENESNVRDN